MKHNRLPLVLALGSILMASPLLALDFTLRHDNIRAEALSQAATYITEGDSKIMLTIPNNWKVLDSPTGLDLTPARAGSRVTISQIGGVQSLPMDASGRVELLKRVVAQLPGGAKNVEALPPVDNLVPIFKWTSVEFSHRYDFYGQKMRRSVLFINMLPGRVVQMSVIAPDDFFEEVHNQARMIISNWFEPKRDLPPELAREYESGQPHGT